MGFEPAFDDELDRFFSLSGEMLSIIGFDGYLKRANPAWEGTLGWRHDELRSRPLLEFTHPDDRAYLSAAFRQLAGGAELLSFEARFGSKVGAYHLLRWNARPLPSRESVYAVARDVSQDGTSERGRQFESIALLAGGVAHDFNNLLTGILGNTSLALDTLPLLSPASLMLQDVIEASQRAAALTRQLLAYSGKGRFLVEQIDLSRLVSGSLLGLLRTLTSKGVRLQLDLEDDLPLIKADPAQMRQVVMNLTINAAEAIGEADGEIRISTGALDISGDEPGPQRYVYLDVSDSGQGMDAETQSKIFDPFFSAKFTGRGLGLAAVSGIVRGHKGTVQLESSPGAGSRFRVLLPAIQTRTATIRKAPIKIDLPAARVILVTEDDPIAIRMTRAALERHGYTVEIAQNGQQTIDLFSRRPDEYAVVLLDIGAEQTLQQIKAIRPDACVIICSGDDDLAVWERFGSDCEVAAFLQKPYTALQLVAKVRSVMQAGYQQ